MARARQRKPRRHRVGCVSYYLHHGAWYVYYRDGSRPIRRRIGPSEKMAAQVNSQLASAAPTMFSFVPITVAELRREFLDYHEDVLRSSLGTVRRYRAATQHVANFAGAQPAHELNVEQFVRYLRRLKVSPNGHANTARRPLRDKGIAYVLETCRSLYGYASEHRHLPPYAEIPCEWAEPIPICIDLFEPPKFVEHAAQALALSESDSKKPLTRKEIGKVLGISTSHAHIAIRYGEALRAAGLTDPYVRLTELPAEVGRWRTHKKYETEFNSRQEPPEDFRQESPGNSKESNENDAA